MDRPCFGIVLHLAGCAILETDGNGYVLEHHYHHGTWCVTQQTCMSELELRQHSPGKSEYAFSLRAALPWVTRTATFEATGTEGQTPVEFQQCQELESMHGAIAQMHMLLVQHLSR